MRPRWQAITRTLRFRLTVSYAIFFALMLAGVGMSLRGFLSFQLDYNLRDVLDQEWAAMKGFLKIARDKPDWFYDRQDPDERYIVARLQRVYVLTDEVGKVIEQSELYRSIGVDSILEIRETLKAGDKATWRIRRDTEGTSYLIRSGVVYADDRVHEPYFVAIGRSLENNNQVLAQFTRIYFGLMPVMIFGGCLLGWVIAGKALTPVTQVATAAQRISGANLSLRIPNRGAGDELDHLIDTFNRMVERLETNFQQIRQFSTDVSHELRTPITAIRGQLEVALFTATNPDHYRDAIANALEDIERLSQIVRALLLLAQSESGQVALQKSRVDLTATARDVIEQFQIPAEESKVRLMADLPAECPAEVDRVQIERMISNLISNAIKFTPPGGEVRVSLKSAGRRLEFSVEDTGCGIAAEHLPFIFDRFYRIPAQSGSGEPGLGLGLSFVAWIARAHGGQVRVGSEVNRGSRFTVSIPAASLALTHEPAVTVTAVR